MPAGTIVGFELWTNWQAAGGQRVGPLEISSWALTQAIDGFVVRKQLTGRLRMNGPFYASVGPSKVVRVNWRDDATTPPTADWEEYRIAPGDNGSLAEDEAGGVASFTAFWWLQDLIDGDLLVRNVTTGGIVDYDVADYATTPAASLARCDTALPSYWSIGTVTPTDTIDVVASGASAIAWAIATAQAVKDVSGVTYEISARANGISGLFLDLTIYGGGSVDVRSGSNLADLRRTKYRRANRMFFPAARRLRRPTYKVSNTSAGAWVEVQGLLGARGPAREDSQWTGKYLFEWKNGTAHLIGTVTKISTTTTRFAVTSTTTLTVGDLVYLADDASGTDIGLVDAPAAATAYGIKAGSLGGVDGLTNLVGENPDFRSNLTGYTQTGTLTLTATTTAGYWRYGGRSYRVQQVTAGANLAAPAVTVNCAVGDVLVITVWYRVTTLGTAIWRAVNPNTSANEDTTIDATLCPTLNVLTSYTRSWVITAAGNKTFDTRLIPQGGDQYWDAVGYYHLPAGSAVPSAQFVAGSGAAMNVAEANTLFDDGGLVTTYDGKLVDLSVRDPLTHKDNRPLFGATCYITAKGLNETRTPLRIVQRTDVNDRPGDPQVQLSTLARRLTALLA